MQRVKYDTEDSAADVMYIYVCGKGLISKINSISLIVLYLGKERYER